MILTNDSILLILSEINSKEDIERRKEALKSYYIYEGELHTFVKKELQRLYPKTHTDYNVADYNILKKIVDKKAKSYVKPPLRKLEQETETDKYNEILETFNFNDAMKVLDQYKNQYRYCGLGIIRTKGQDSDGTNVDFYDFWALAPHEFCVHRDSEEKIYAWSIPKGKNESGDIWHIWTNESQVKVQTKDYTSFVILEIAENPDNVNPYGVIPFVYVPMDVSGKYPLPSSLPRQTIEVNKNLSIYLTSGNMQVGQLVISHPTEQKINELATSMMVAMNLPQSGKEKHGPTTAQYISPNPNLEGHKDSVLTYMMMILDEHGMNANSSLKGAEKFTSGFDRLIANADVQDAIEDNQGIYKRVEGHVYLIIKSMTDGDGSYTFKSKKLTIKYALPKILTSDSEKLDNLKKKKDLGLWEEWELILESDPNLSEEEAKKKAETIKATNGNNQGRSQQDIPAEAATVA